MITAKRSISAGFAAALSLLAIAVLPATGETKSNSGFRSYHGKVTRISQANQAFRVRLNSGSAKRFRVNGSTTYEDVSGFGGLSKGQKLEVKAKKGSSLARRIEVVNGASAGGDDRGGAHHANGSDDSTADDHGSGGNGADDPAGDDHGSGGHSADDGAGHDVGDDHGSGGHGADDAAGDDHGGHHGGGEAGDDHGSGGHGSDD